jgi:aminoglycoside phosphotransferase (APT) family kinase protein
MPPPDAELVAHALARVLGPVTVDGTRRLSGGASRETWAFDACDAGGTRHELILRRDPGGHRGSTSRATEYDVLVAAHRAGVAAPAPVLLLEPDDGLGDGFVMRRVAGETIARKILRDDEFAGARGRLARQCGEQAARIHAVDLAALRPAELPVLGAPEQLAQYRGVLDALGEPHPAFELGLRWLDEHVPAGPDEGPRLVHGDFRTGNLVVGADGLRAVLDWELAHLGNPVEDLGWLCVKSWRFGVADRPVGGFGDYATLLDAYASAGGGAVDLAALRYWEAFGTLKWGVICAMQATLHTSGTVRSVELAALGRRVAEMEWDLLVLLDELGHG